MLRTKNKRETPLPYFEAGDFLVIYTSGWQNDRLIVKVLPNGKHKPFRAIPVWRMGQRAEDFQYKVAHVSRDCAWIVEVVGRGDEVSKEG